MDVYVIDYGSTHITSSLEFDTLPEAEAWQAQVLLHDPTVGTLFTLDAFKLTPNGQAFSLKAAKRQKLAELTTEALTRTGPGIQSIATLEAIAVVLAEEVPSSIQGLNDRAVLTAYLGAALVIVALPTVFDVDAYDVVNDPSWPTVAILTTNLANLQILTESSGLTTTLAIGVWTIVDALMTQNGSSDNFTLAISQATYTGDLDQEIVASLAISGHSDGGTLEAYRIGLSVNGADPVHSFGMAAEKDNGLCTATVGFVLPTVSTGDTIVPMIQNIGSGTDFVLSDMVLTIGRWTV